MALEIQSPLETRNVALDNIIFTVNSLGIFVLNISFYTASCFILELIAVFRFFLQVVFGERIRPSLYNVSNSFYLRSCLDDFMFIWAIHQLISRYICQLSFGVLQSTFLCCNWCILHSIYISIVQQSLFIFFCYLLICVTDYVQEGCNM